MTCHQNVMADLAARVGAKAIAFKRRHRGQLVQITTADGVHTIFGAHGTVRDWPGMYRDLLMVIQVCGRADHERT